MKDFVVPILFGISAWAVIGCFACACYAVFAGKLRDAEADEEGEA